MSYDVDETLRAAARVRRRLRNNPTTATVITHAHLMAEGMKRELSPEAWETAGITLLLAHANLEAVCQTHDPAGQTPLAWNAVDVVLFAGEQLVRDARACDDADRAGTPR